MRRSTEHSALPGCWLSLHVHRQQRPPPASRHLSSVRVRPSSSLVQIYHPLPSPLLGARAHRSHLRCSAEPPKRAMESAPPRNRSHTREKQRSGLLCSLMLTDPCSTVRKACRPRCFACLAPKHAPKRVLVGAAVLCLLLEPRLPRHVLGSHGGRRRADLLSDGRHGGCHRAPGRQVEGIQP